MHFFFLLWFILYSLISKAEISQQLTDSISNESYESLQKLFYANLKNINLANQYAEYFLNKAKRDEDKVKVADGYHHFFIINTPKIAMKYVDSIIDLTKDLSHHNYPSRGYLNKGVLLQNNKKLNEAFKYHLKAKFYAEKNNNNIHKVAATLNIAQLKLQVGKEKEALDVFKTNYDFLQTQDTKGKFYAPYIGTLLGLAVIYNQRGKLDSAKIYIDEGFEKVLKSKESYGHSGLLLANGVNDYHRGNYQNAIDSLQKLLSMPLRLAHKVNTAEANLYLAKTYNKINKQEISFEYLNKVNDLVDSTNYSPYTREAFEMLLATYKKNNDAEKQLQVLEKMITLDSISNAKNNRLNIEIYQKYDTRELIVEKNKLLNGLKKQKSTSSIIYIILGVVIFGFSFFLYKNYSKRVYYKKKFDLLINDQVQTINTSKKEPINSIKNIDLQEEIIEEILEKINVFEQEKKFIDGKLTLAKLAKKIGTNSTYLSKIINYYKGQNFANYINDLRIDYAVEQIKINSNFRKYTIKSIGNEVGFNTVQSFSKAFYKKTGLKPLYFIKKLDKQAAK